jgi:two-component system cell cycle sensor histidine kinase/response regulator CckA
MLAQPSVNEFSFPPSPGSPPGIPALRDPLGPTSESPPSAEAKGEETGQETNPLKAKIAQFGVVAETDLKLKKLQDELAATRESLDQWAQAEAVWNSQRRLFKVMTENVTDLIVLLDDQGNRLWSNPAYTHALGYAPDEIAGTYGLSEVHPEDRSRAVEAFEQALARKTTRQAEYRVQQKNGKWLDLQTEIVPIVTPDNRVESLVLMAHNVTETKELQEIVKNASKQSKASSMVEGMARDFDLILTNVFGNLAIARNLNGSNNAVSARLGEVERSLQRGRDLIEQMFSLSTTGEQPHERMSLEPVVHEAVSSVLRGTMIRAEYNFVRNLPELDLDREGFAHVLRNLITNSVQSMDKGVVRLSAELVSQEQLAQHPDVPLKPGNYVCLVIRDQGHGMTERTLMHAFEPYFTTRAGAQGLGLTTALAAIQRMGGTILLDSTEFVGTTAYVYLPAAAAVAPTRVGRTGTVALASPPAEKKRILLMDDEQMILDIVSRMLTHLGYEVTICTDGAQAIAAFAKAKSNGQPYDVVLMDLVIPDGVGGQDAVHTIRKIDANAKVIASSGHLEHPAMTDHRKFGFVAVLEKPYRLERLQQVIDGVIAG